ncbi:hypothetical protein CHS0354_029698 [Potamilus streckersoni]|uniref:Dipeptidyl peptidase 1 n=2 Tax=Potamilus streckersoni TaxID=2493646 RepID=A0AAE0VJV2_9BIVA|nr:hypothetical protein CHS0354_029698 [Potamilus streckersoni]
MRMPVSLFIIAAFLASLAIHVFADTPANCTYEDIRGKWIFMIGNKGHDQTLNCSSFASPVMKLEITLYFPDLAIDQFGNTGFWTIIYNQGFEIVITGRKYFAFSKYKQDGNNITSVCDQTLPGWSHDIFDRNWACFIGQKTEELRPKQTVFSHKELRVESGRLYRQNDEFIHQINQQQKSWQATRYPQFEKMRIEDMIKMKGGRKSTIASIPKPAPVTPEVAIKAKRLPDNFDWRNYNDINYVSPVRNQGNCGSCYAFASLAMNEARIRVMTNNTLTPVFSPQDIVECSEYSQGCDGGFPYLISGKYAEDFGLVEEECNPYKGIDGKCSTKPSCQRHYSTKYQYVGGFYGACNEELMRINLVENGPMAVSFEVYDDFFHYKGGIYIHTGLRDKFNPFEITNHAVLLVGYGVEPSTGQKYWVVKNSWGETWGEMGFFRIRRGTDECSIESIAVQSEPVL